MAKLIVNDVEYYINDGSAIAETCADAGVPFNCNTGVCGSCAIRILSGQENLSALTQEEKDLNLNKDIRLACQCAIKSGTVKAAF
ncbi:MAG: 2Fe-2S iron-sulfur cluster-binding protein [Candidatus Omnitrophota bacterium]